MAGVMTYAYSQDSPCILAAKNVNVEIYHVIDSVHNTIVLLYCIL